MLLYLFSSIGLLLLGYFLYGRFLERKFNVRPDETVPSSAKYDGVDFVPTNKFVLLGHHFSSIAGAGPIVGPIIAASAFGWLPVLLWVVAGAIFIGGMHDFSSLVISLRNQGKSVGEIVKTHLNVRLYRLFLLFIWLTLMYVITVFTDLAADTFAAEPAVAQVGILYIFMAMFFGVMVYRFRWNLTLSTVIMLFISLLGIYLNMQHPFLAAGKQAWMMILLVYCAFASVLPVWFLLQPRDYLSSFLLYVSLFLGLFGLLFGGHEIVFPAFTGFSDPSIGPLMPFLFITVACGAISGFHALVASGTTSKQLDSAKNARFVSYGGMILEGVVAVVALGTIMMVARGSSLLQQAPARIYAEGIGQFAALIGVDAKTGVVFGLLIISAFILTTLDTATRLARYILQELTGVSSGGWRMRVGATLLSLVLPLVLLNMDFTGPGGNPLPAWKAIWPVFGATNQLLAALVLVVVFVFVRRTGRALRTAVLVPAFFMIAMTMAALYQILARNIALNLWNAVTFIAAALFLLSFSFLVEVSRVIFRERKEA